MKQSGASATDDVLLKKLHVSCHLSLVYGYCCHSDIANGLKLLTESKAERIGFSGRAGGSVIVRL